MALLQRVAVEAAVAVLLLVPIQKVVIFQAVAVEAVAQEQIMAEAGQEVLRRQPSLPLEHLWESPAPPGRLLVVAQVALLKVLVVALVLL
jgi:hypothetical protein